MTDIKLSITTVALLALLGLSHSALLKAEPVGAPVSTSGFKVEVLKVPIQRADGDYGLLSYVNQFGPLFANALVEMGNQGHWIDSGTGAGIALAEFVSAASERDLYETKEKAFSRKSRNLSSLAHISPLFNVPPPARGKVTGIDLKQFAHHDKWNEHSQLTFLNTKPVEKIATSQVNPADIITDLFGAFDNSTDKVGVLQSYVNWIKPQGKIFLTFSRSTKVIMRDRRKVPITDWIKTIPGLKVSYTHGPKNYNQIMVEANRPNIKIPSLKYLEEHEPRHVYVQ